MKRKTISAIISKKFDAWVASITDAHVKGMVESNTICTGGCIASMLLGEPVNDYDFYFRNYETALAVTNYYVAEFKNATDNHKRSDECSSIRVEAGGQRISIVVKCQTL